MMKRFTAFLAAALIGFLLRQLGIPIPYMLGGIVTGFAVRSFLDNAFQWPRSWRGLMLGVAGYGIGSNCTPDTFFKLSQETLGIFGACLFTLAVSVGVAVHMHRHTFANLLSSIMGCLPGGLTAMTVLMDDYEEADENVVVVSQCLRLFVVEVSVPFLAINLFGGEVTRSVGVSLWSTSMADFLSLFHPGWLLVVPLVLIGRSIAKAIHMPTGQLLGPIIVTSLFALWQGSVPRVPAPAMAFAQLHIGLYIGTMLDREKLLKTRELIPNVLLGSLLMVASSAALSVFMSRLYGFSTLTGFLALAPGGIAEMCLTGMEMHQDVAVILTYQLVRVLMLAMGVPFVIRRFFKPDSGKKGMLHV